MKVRQGYEDRQGHNTFPELHDDVRVRPMLPLWGGGSERGLGNSKRRAPPPKSAVLSAEAQAGPLLSILTQGRKV